MDPLENKIMLLFFFTICIPLIATYYIDNYRKNVDTHKRQWFLIRTFAIIVIISVVIFGMLFKTILGYLLTSSKANKASIFIIFGLYFCTSTLFACIYYLIFLYNQNSFNITPIKNKLGKTNFLELFIAIIYFSFSTFFTVGFGDIIPQSNLARVVTIVHTFIGFYMTAYIFATVVSLDFVARYQKDNL